MLLFLLTYLGGTLTILSPCVLPVLPFVFARSEKSFRRSGLPILLGMAGTFTILASFATIGGAWLVGINQYGRYAAMLILLVLGLALIFPSLSERIMSPFVNLGGHLQARADQEDSIKSSVLLGIALGFLWAPCAGPILGLVLAGAALNGLNLKTALLLLTFAAGAATSLGVALLASGKVIGWLKRHFGAEEMIRRALGVLVVLSVVIVAMGWDTRFLAAVTSSNTTAAEEKLIAALGKPTPPAATARRAQAPSIEGATQWLNSRPISDADLRGKVVLIDFWTYSCINCLRTLPYIKAWDAKYRDKGFVIIGVHAPEFAFERDINNVKKAVKELGVNYPVAIDNQFTIWNAYQNIYWPAHYLIDATGRIRHHHFGEGAYAETEAMIRALLQEAHPDMKLNDDNVNVSGAGASAASGSMTQSPETYIGYARQEHLASPEPVQRDRAANYTAPAQLAPDDWALGGTWQIGKESAVLKAAGGSITFHFRGRDLHLVLATQHGKPVRFRVTLDGEAPGEDAGTDIDAKGHGIIREQRLYQLIRQNGKIKNRTFRIEFLDKAAEAFAFTFG